MRPSGPGQPTRFTFATSGVKPRHTINPDGVEEWRYPPHGLDAASRAHLDDRPNDPGLITQLRQNRSTTIRIGIVGQLSEPFLNYEPADTTLFHPADVRRVELIRILEAHATLEAGLSAATQHEWSEVYTVYLAEDVRPR